MKKCIICNEIKPYDDFNKNTNSLDGKLNKCKPCLKTYLDNLKSGVRMSEEDRKEILQQTKLKAMSHEKEISDSLLKMMGYEVESELSIHEQFLIRHNLITNEPLVSY
jgi:hypothetical protein